MIMRLSTMTVPQSLAYMEYYEQLITSGINGFIAMRPADEFDERGLRFPQEYLNTIRHSVVFLPLELMAEHVDIVTMQMVDSDNQQFIADQIISKRFALIDFKTTNATTIGNIAYVCLNSKNSEAREIAERMLNDVFELALTTLSILAGVNIHS